jgi:hypothetical protein
MLFKCDIDEVAQRRWEEQVLNYGSIRQAKLWSETAMQSRGDRPNNIQKEDMKMEWMGTPIWREINFLALE